MTLVADARYIAWQHDRGAVGILDDRRPDNCRAAGERSAVHDRGVRVTAGFGEPGQPLPTSRLRRNLSPTEGRAAAVRRDRRDQRPVYGLNGALGVEELVPAQVGLPE